MGILTKLLSYLDKINVHLDDVSLDKVRIEPLRPYQSDIEIDTDIVWFQDNNIEACIRATSKYQIKHIHLQTSHIKFLIDARLSHVKGITIQYAVENLEPLYQFKALTHLSLPEHIKFEFDFSHFKDLIYLSGQLPKKHINIQELKHLKYIKLFDYPKKDLYEFSHCTHLQSLSLYNASIENLQGLSACLELEKIDLNDSLKLRTLDGIKASNKSLKQIQIIGARWLKNADSLKQIPNLEQLRLYNVLELDSLDFLYALPKLNTIGIAPQKVGVKGKDYYPLIEALKRTEQLQSLKKWKPLKSYLDGTFEVPKNTVTVEKSALQLLKENLGLLEWVEKGLKQYTKKNCQKAEAILVNMIDKLESLEQDNLIGKEEAIKNGILELNQFNKNIPGFIETQEREELCDLFDSIAEAAGLDIQTYEDGIASQWREW